MFLLAAVRRPGGTEQTVKVRNLSPGGMMAESPSGFVRGDPIEVDLRGVGVVPGRIAWTASGRIGVQFDRQIDHRLARVTGPSPDQAAIKLVSPPKAATRPGRR